MQLYTEKDFLKVIPEFLSHDENRRILADMIFQQMCLHNTITSNDDDYNKNLLKNSETKLNVTDIPKFLSDIMSYYYKSTKQAITIPRKIKSKPYLIGMYQWLSFVIGDYPEMMAQIEQHFHAKNAYEFKELLLAIHQNNSVPELFKNIVEKLAHHQAEFRLLATLIDSNEALQLLVI